MSFFSNVLINRSLGIELRGQYTTIVNYANFLQLVLNLGICYTYPSIKKEKGEVYTRELISTIIWLQTFFLILGLVIAIVNNPSYNIIFIFILSIALITNNQLNFIALLDDIKRRNILLLSSTCLYILMNFLAIIFFPGNLYIVIILLVIKYIYEVISICISYKYCVFNLSIINRKIIMNILKNGIPMAILSILISCNYNIDIFMLNWMKSGDIEIGIYGVAYSLTNILWIFPDAFKEMVYHKTTTNSNYFIVIKYIIINIIFNICIYIGFLILGTWFLNIVYGEQYIIAFKVTLILFFGVIPMIAFKLIHPIYVNNGKAKIIIYLLSISVIVNIISSWILIPNWGAFGAATASVISYTICGILFFVKFYYDFCLYKK